MLLLRVGTSVAGTTVVSRSLLLAAASSQYASIADGSQAGLDVSGNITLECWVKLTSAPSDAGWRFISKWRGSNNQKAYHLSYQDVSGTKQVQLAISTDGSTTTSHIINHDLGTATWHHVAATRDSSNGSVEMFVDGSSIGTSSGASGSLFNSSEAFAVGAENTTGTASNFLDARIDEVRVWSVLRTATEINNNKAVDVSGSANLQGYWRFNDDYTDGSGNGNTLVASGSPSFSTDVPF